MAYKVLVDFTDLKTGKVHLKGESYTASPERLKELSGTDNKRKEAVIEEVKKKPATKKQTDK